MKIFNVLLEQGKHKDNAPQERYEYNQIGSTIEAYCDKYLEDANDILRIEALSSAIDHVVSFLESPKFLEKYEFGQESDTVFLIKLREIDILG